ncbi:DoxX protein [Granulosicoccus antarcticus]|uniref:DoxX family protein n=1 Tax=Granulosicoccus antarcticus IMCC3135 TaxID=1192854 RepID=A0A2Z2NIR2_9GAMM|nr:DoxX protein [Granulosicoccus antarcticus]ASJ71226.1 hypothetical protein IMCC3135_05570 [Granulosicoccus antarcticus IMCC3135]
MSSSTQKSLAVLRIGLFLFMMVWAMEKFVRPESFQAIFGKFYGFDAGMVIIYLIGAIQVGILLLFVTGKFKTVSYGLVMIMNVLTLLVSYRQVLNPYEGSVNHLFVASIVIAAASIAMFMARADDHFLTLKAGEPSDESNQLEVEASNA